MARSLLLVALCLAFPSAAHGQGYFVMADLKALPGAPVVEVFGQNKTATGYFMLNGVDAGVVTGSGGINYIEPNIDASNGVDCTAANGCGAHVHSGTACDNSDTQGGHLFDGDDDPWAAVGYSKTTQFGYASFDVSVAIGADFGLDDVVGKPFIIHASDGSRIACGMIEKKPIAALLDEKYAGH